MFCRSKTATETVKKGVRKRTRALLFGVLTGFGLGLLFAPKTGAEMQAKLREKLIRKLPL